jgi:Flp pilus assembly protein TadB
MHPKGDSLVASQTSSVAVLCLISFSAALFVFCVAVFFQWLVYDDWLHDQGPLRIVGSLLAASLMFVVSLRRQLAHRRREIEIQQHLQALMWMNDRIRNSLQTIECVTYAASPQTTDSVRSAVDSIEDVLDEMLIEKQASVPHQARSVPPAKSIRIEE